MSASSEVPDESVIPCPDASASGAIEPTAAANHPLTALEDPALWSWMAAGVADGLVLLDSAGCILRGSMFGDDMVTQFGAGRRLADALPEDQRAGWERAIRAAARGGLPVTWGAPWTASDGVTRWVSCRIAPMTDAGALRGFTVVAVDATRQRETELALDESRRVQSTLLGNLPGIAYRCDNDPKWTMRFVSSGCHALTGYPPQDLVNNRRVCYADLIVPEDRASVWEKVQEALRRKEPFRTSYRIRAADGTVKWVWEQGTGVFDSAGALLGIEGFITDISEQRMAHDALHAAHHDLEQRVDERTRELTAANENLRRALEDRDRISWLLKAIVDNVPMMLFVKHAETLVVELWNDAAAELSGVPASAIVGRTGYEVFPSEQMQAFHERDRAVIRYRKLIAAEEILTTARGERWLYTRKIPLNDENGVPRYLLGISEDITDRKRAAAEAEERTMLSVLSADVAAVITSGIRQGPMLQECARLVAARLGTALLRVWTFDDGADVFHLEASVGDRGVPGADARTLSPQCALLAELIRSPQPRVAVLSPEDRPEEFGWDQPGRFSAFAGFALRADDRVLGVLALYAHRSFSDAVIKAMTALADHLASGIQARRSEAALRQSLERFDLMVEGAKVGLWDAMVVADDPYNPRNPIYYSPRCKELLGFAPEEFPDVVGSWADRLHPEDRERVFRALDDHLFRRIPYDIEYRMIHRSGEVRWYAARGQAQWDHEGRPVRLSGSLMDITDRKESEHQLLEAREAAETANRAKSRFLANISHEIRTPIAAMLSAAELLAHADPSDRQRRIDLILRNTRHLMSLIDDLLDFSRLEAGKLDVTRIPCSLIEILLDIQAVTLPLAKKPHVEFRMEVGSDIPETIHTDPIRLRQAVINLVNNALKYTDAGFVVVRVAVNPEAPEPRLTIEVSDSGIGISAQELARVFEAFERASQPAARLESGVGLGLTIARWIASQLGGELTARSEPGRGSTFTLRVATGPLSATRWLSADRWAAASTSLSGLAPRIAPGQLVGKVLLAEDYADTREVLAYALKSAGAEVIVADNGEDAVAAASEQSFDLILMDIRMPRMDGLAATTELRRRGCLAPIIALTASTATSDRERIIHAGFDDFWTKPISLERLIRGASAYLESGPAIPGKDTEPPVRASHVRSRLDILADEFIAGLPDRVKAIRELVTSGDAAEAANRIHQIIGAAGVHGLDDVCTEAARLQRRFRETRALSVEQLAPLEHAVKSLIAS